MFLKDRYRPQQSGRDMVSFSIGFTGLTGLFQIACHQSIDHWIRPHNNKVVLEIDVTMGIIFDMVGMITDVTLDKNELEMRSEKEQEAFLETGDYIYTNPITRWITLKGHQACARLRRYDMPGVTVVDLGCGEGDHFPFVKQADILGIDILPEMLERAAGKYPGRARLMQGDIFSISELLPQPGSVKSIVSVGTLEHLAPLEKALEEIERILADDGEFIWGIPTEGLLYRIGRELTTKRHVQKVTGVDYNALLAQEHVNRCRDVVRALKCCFHIDTMRGVPFGIPSVDLNFMLVGRCVKK